MKQQFRAGGQRSRAIVSEALLCGALALAAGCQKEKPPEPAPAPPPAPAAEAQPAPPPEPAKPAAKPLEWDDPSPWKKVPASGMRAASYEIPAAKGDKESGQLNVFVLGGDVDANIQRWIDEFSGMNLKTVVRNDRTVNDMRQAVVEIPKGKFSGGMGDKGPSDNYGLLGAIVVAPSGAEYFFKLTGPSATVKAARAPFYALLDSIREQGGSPQPQQAGDETTKGSKASTSAKAEGSQAVAAKPAAKP